jgi:hypothetical protein
MRKSVKQQPIEKADMKIEVAGYFEYGMASKGYVLHGRLATKENDVDATYIRPIRRQRRNQWEV